MSDKTDVLGVKGRQILICEHRSCLITVGQNHPWFWPFSWQVVRLILSFNVFSTWGLSRNPHEQTHFRSLC